MFGSREIHGDLFGILGCSRFFGAAFCRAGDCDRRIRAFLFAALHEDLSAVEFDDLAHDGEPESAPSVFSGARPVGLVEGL